jgi:hypothetical protein
MGTSVMSSGISTSELLEEKEMRSHDMKQQHGGSWSGQLMCCNRPALIVLNSKGWEIVTCLLLG